MTITLGQLKNAESALRKLLNHDLPISVSYNLRKLVKAAESELSHFEAERVKLVTKFGVKNQDDDGMTVAPEHLEEFHAEMTKLFDMEIEVTTYGIDLDKLFDSDLKMTAVEMAQLEPFFKPAMATAVVNAS